MTNKSMELYVVEFLCSLKSKNLRTTSQRSIPKEQSKKESSGFLLDFCGQNYTVSKRDRNSE